MIFFLKVSDLSIPDKFDRPVFKADELNNIPVPEILDSNDLLSYGFVRIKSRLETVYGWDFNPATNQYSLISYPRKPNIAGFYWELQQYRMGLVQSGITLDTDSDLSLLKFIVALSEAKGYYEVNPDQDIDLSIVRFEYSRFIQLLPVDIKDDIVSKIQESCTKFLLSLE